MMHNSLSGGFIQRNTRNVRNVTKWRRYWIGESQPPATTAYAAGTLPSYGRHTIKWNYRNLIWFASLIAQQVKTYWNLGYLFVF